MENVRVRKLTLDLNELEVESFDSSPSLQDQRGTVKGQSGYYETCWSCNDWCEYPTWGTCHNTCYTCGASCNPYTCPDTCAGTCHTCDSCEPCPPSGYYCTFEGSTC